VRQEIKAKAKIKETPIIFNAEMVRAILDGRKTQTRRVIQLPKWAYPLFTFHSNEDGDFEIDDIFVNGKRQDWAYAISKKTGCLAAIDCPYGARGDRLWVRETHRFQEKCGLLIQYRADWCAYWDSSPRSRQWPKDLNKWRPSIHMFRWASRTTLEVVGVRIERLQKISEGDAKAEGWTPPRDRQNRDTDRPQVWFRKLWNTLNAKRGYGWDVNPWVWVIEFKRIDAT